MEKIEIGRRAFLKTAAVAVGVEVLAGLQPASVTTQTAAFYRRAYRYLGNAADAEDAVQDALLSACRHLDQFKGKSKMSTWLTTIVINSALTQLRRRPRQNHTSLDEQLGEEPGYCVSERLADSRPSPEDECIKLELYAQLMHFVQELPPASRYASNFVTWWADNKRSSTDSGSGGCNSEGPCITSAHEAQAADSKALDAQPRSAPTRTAL